MRFSRFVKRRWAGHDQRLLDDQLYAMQDAADPGGIVGSGHADPLSAAGRFTGTGTGAFTGDGIGDGIQAPDPKVQQAAEDAIETEAPQPQEREEFGTEL